MDFFTPFRAVAIGRLDQIVGIKLIADHEIVIGPFVLSLVDDIEAVMNFTEFGVVMMLFLQVWPFLLRNLN